MDAPAGLLVAALLPILLGGLADPEAPDPEAPGATGILHPLLALSRDPVSVQDVAPDGTLHLHLGPPRAGAPCTHLDPLADADAWQACTRLRAQHTLDRLAHGSLLSGHDAGQAQTSCRSDGSCRLQVPPRAEPPRPTDPDPPPAAPAGPAAQADPRGAGAPETQAPAPVSAGPAVAATVLPAAAAVGLAMAPWQQWVASPRLLGPLRRAGALAGGILLYSRLTGQDLLENGTRRAITDLLQQRPGASIQEIRTRTDVAWGTAVYHLARLEREGLVVSHRHANHRRYFLAGSTEARHRASLSVLEAATARRLARAVMTHPGASQTRLCKEVGIGNPAASKHLRRLEDHQLVRSETDRRCRRYWATDRMEQLGARALRPRRPRPGEDRHAGRPDDA